MYNCESESLLVGSYSAPWLYIFFSFSFLQKLPDVYALVKHIQDVHKIIQHPHLIRSKAARSLKLVS